MNKRYILIIALLYFGTGLICKAQYTVIHHFNDTLGANPYGSLTLSGNMLYGVTSTGGAKDTGCIFSVRTDGTGYKDLHDFNISTNVSNGTGSSNFSGALTLLGNTLYGTTTDGIYSIHTDGSFYTSIFKFKNGEGPNGTLILSAGDSLLYGSTPVGDTSGTSSNKGYIFSIRLDGSGYKQIFDFNTLPCCSSDLDPAALTFSRKNNQFYGMTGQIGSQTWRLYSINSDGTGLKDLHLFQSTNGRGPGYSVILSQNDTVLYGMTSSEPSGGAGLCLFHQT